MTFSYTDDAIVSTSPTGRHLSTVIKRPVVLMSGWNEHAEQVCKVLNELQPDHPVRNLTAAGYDWAQFHEYCAAGTNVRLELASAIRPQSDWAGIIGSRAELAETLKQRDLQVSDLRGQVEAIKKRPEPTFWVRVGNCEPQALVASDAVAVLTACLEQKSNEVVRSARELSEAKAELDRARSKAEGAEDLLAAGRPTEPKSLKSWVDYGHKIYAYAIEQGKVRDSLTAQLSEAKASLARAEEILKAPIVVSASVANSLLAAEPGALVHTLGGQTFKRVGY